MTLQQETEEQKRRFGRVDTRMAVRVSMPMIDQERLLYVSNISSGGVFINCPRDLPDIGQFVDFEILEAGNPLRGAGLVRWRRERDLKSQPAGFGIEFGKLPADTAGLVRRYLDGATSKE